MVAIDHARRRDLEPTMITIMTMISIVIMITVSCGPSLSMAQKASNIISSDTSTTIVAVKVGVILDMKTSFGKMGLSSVKMALSDFYAANPHYATRLLLHTRDSDSAVVAAAASALDLIKNEQVQAIIGPVTSMQANFVIQLGNEAQVPIVTFSAKSPSLTSLRSPFFFRIAANDSAQVGAIAAVVKAFGWRQVVPIYVDNEYGDGVIPFLTDALQAVDARVPYRSVIPPAASDDFIAAELYKLMTMSTRVFVVHMLPELGARVFAKAEEIGMMSKGYVWIVTDGIADFFTSANSSTMESMQGVVGVKTYVPKSERLESFVGRWRTEFRRDYPTVLDVPMVVFGLWAYDAVFALAMAVEETSKVAKLGFKRTNLSRESTDLESFSVSQSGPRLAEALSRTRFKGLSGDFRLVNGQLETSKFEIVNVNGSGERRLGFWTVERGLAKTPDSRSKTTSYSTSNMSLRVIIWPGDSTSAPKGWQIPTNGKVLRIGVPMKKGFEEFVNISSPISNDTVSGYCIDVFKAVLGAMPYSVPFEFVPFVDAQGKSAGTYNDLVYQVYLQKFDAVVGDVTIRANRSLYVDFTLPYTESGVSMIVPIKDDKNKNAWVFLKPLTWDLWLTSGCFFIFIGFIVWVLEHRINKDFRGPPHHQIGTSLWYSFSTMVFGHRENVVSNWARFVVIIWCFVVLILTQSYTASLTSLLTVQKLQPTVTDINQLLRNRENVGFQKGSFVEGLLRDMGFDKSQFKIYNSPEELFGLFANGSTKGGIAAAFDETPYMKLFIAKYCSKFTMVEPTFKADGFAFVFPKGSPLVPDISRAILKVTEGQQMKNIEAIWFKKEKSCPDPSNQLSSNSLSLQSFWGLFLIAGVASFLALIVTIAMFLYEERDKLLNASPETSVWDRIKDVLDTFNQIDQKSHTLRRGQVGDRSVVDRSVADRSVVADASPSNTNFPPSPPRFSVQSDGSFMSREQGTTSGTKSDDASPSGARAVVDGEIVSTIELTPDGHGQKRPSTTN